MLWSAFLNCIDTNHNFYFILKLMSFYYLFYNVYPSEEWEGKNLEKRQLDASWRKMPNYNKPLQVPPAASAPVWEWSCSREEVLPAIWKGWRNREYPVKQHFVTILCCSPICLNFIMSTLLNSNNKRNKSVIHVCQYHTSMKTSILLQYIGKMLSHKTSYIVS